MTVTQEFIEQVAEALNVLGDALENSAGYPRGAEVITDETEITDTLSLPGVLYDADPRTHDEAQALKYVQIPWSVLSTLLTTMQDAVTAASGELENMQTATANVNSLIETLNALQNTIRYDEMERQRNEAARQQAEVQRQNGYLNIQERVAYAIHLAENYVHPPYIADGTETYPGDYGYLYQWDSETEAYVRGQQIVIVRVATEETCRSIVDELV